MSAKRRASGAAWCPDRDPAPETSLPGPRAALGDRAMLEVARLLADEADAPAPAALLDRAGA